MPHYKYTDWTKGEPVLTRNCRTGEQHQLTIKQTTRGGHFWGDGPYHKIFKGEVVFECDAPGILEADAMLKSATGIEAAKAFNVGCSIS